MRNIWTICEKELKSYFASPIAYLAMAMFAIIFGFFFWNVVAYFYSATSIRCCGAMCLFLLRCLHQVIETPRSIRRVRCCCSLHTQSPCVTKM